MWLLVLATVLQSVFQFLVAHFLEIKFSSVNIFSVTADQKKATSKANKDPPMNFDRQNSLPLLGIYIQFYRELKY